MTVPNYEELDPGIRKVVRWLNDNGFKTVDSGDGRTKFTEDGKPLPEWESGDPDFDMVIPHPHVVIEVTPEALVSETDRLHRLVQERVAVEPIGFDDEGVSLQGTYDPALPEHPAFILVMGLV